MYHIRIDKISKILKIGIPIIILGVTIILCVKSFENIKVAKLIYDTTNIKVGIMQKFDIPDNSKIVGAYHYEYDVYDNRHINNYIKTVVIERVVLRDIKGDTLIYLSLDGQTRRPVNVTRLLVEKGINNNYVIEDYYDLTRFKGDDNKETVYEDPIIDIYTTPPLI